MNEILFGTNPVTEVLNANRRQVFEVYLQADKGKTTHLELYQRCQVQKISCHLVERSKLDTLAKEGRHQGVVAKVSEYPYLSETDLINFPPKATLVACDSISDPQNLGAICRSALVFGIDALIFPKDRSAEVNATVAKASAGASEHLKIARITNLARTLENLKKDGFWVYAAETESKNNLNRFDFADRSVVVLGSEGEGIRPLVRKMCDESFCIPQTGHFNSLNVAQAATVIFYQISCSKIFPKN